MRELLRRTDMRLYLLGQGLSLFGSMSLWLAAGIWVKTVTDSYGAAGMAFFCITLGTLTGPLTGLLVDRFRRRPLLIATNLAGAALLVPLLVSGGRQLWLVYAVMFGYGSLHGMIASGQSALLAGMLPDRLLPHANGALRTVQESLRLVAPLAGAGLFAWQGFGAVVLLDIIGFLAAALTLLLIRCHDAAPVRTGEPFGTAVVAGLRHLAGSTALRGITVATAVAMTVFGFGESALFAVAELSLGLPTEFVGVLMMVQGVGAIVAGPVAGFLIGRYGELKLAAAGLALLAVSSAAYVVPAMPVVMLAAVLCGAGLPWLAIGATTLLQRHSPQHLQGRVYTAFELSITVPQTVSIAAGAVLIGVVGYQALLLAAGVVLAVAAALVLRVGRRSLQPSDDRAVPDVAATSPEPVRSEDRHADLCRADVA